MICIHLLKCSNRYLSSRAILVGNVRMFSQTVTTTKHSLIRGKTFDDHLAEHQKLPNPFESSDDLRYLYNEWNYRDSDILTAGYWKSGTTWLCLSALKLVARGNPVNYHHNTTNYGIASDGQTCIGKDGEPHSSMCSFGMAETSENLKHGRRVFKSHAPWTLTNPNGNPRYVVIARDGRDQAVSSYFFIQSLKDREVLLEWRDELSEYIDNWITGNTVWGDWFVYNHDYFEASKIDSRILFVTYEDMVKDKVTVLRRMRDHFEMAHSDEELQVLADEMTFEKMKKNAKTFDYRMLDIYRCEPNFNRKGVVGDWKNYWTSKQNDAFLQKFQQTFEEDNPWEEQILV